MNGPLSGSPIFYDASGQRRRWSKRVLLTLLLVIVLAAAGFAGTILKVPTPDPLAMGFERAQPRALGAQVAHLRRTVGRSVRRMTAWLPGGHAPRVAGKTAKPVTVAFYAPWDDTSRISLSAHINQIDWLVPALGSVWGPGGRLAYAPDPALRTILHTQAHAPALYPMVQNARDGRWDAAAVERILANRQARGRLLDDIAAMLKAEHAAGVTFDFEELPPTAHPAYRRLLSEARARFAPQGLKVLVAAPVDDPQWDLAAFAHVADRLFLMAYDEHYPGSEPGPIASQPWFVARVREAVAKTGADKAIVAVGAYAYDWKAGRTDAEAQTNEDAWLIAHDAGAATRFDPVSGEATFAYQDDGGQAHQVWMLDAASAWNQLRAAKSLGVSGYALWRLGGEDPGVWADFASLTSGDKPPAFGPVAALGDTEVENNGEILRIGDVPAAGERTASTDARGLIRDERYARYPTPYVVERTGYQPKKIALTFDDGPDAKWTPQILAILRQKKVPATFFVVGENALAHPLLLKSILASGSEIGNHSYTHPDFSQLSPRGVELELNTTQRLVEAYTGRSLRLFRAPYFGDAEPTGAKELYPVLLAQQAGYVSVGLHADSEDWTRPGVQKIVDNALSAVDRGAQAVADGRPERSANIVLLHDSGGDRAQTVAALPAVIDGLRARGYDLVPVSQLAGLTPGEVNPVIRGADLAAVRFDVACFLLLAGLGQALKFLFFFAIVLGTLRAILMAGLAITSNLKRNRPTPPPIDPARFVSVLIPAYNEARVIEASVARVLESADVELEVIVIDDGSKDETSAIVERAFGADPRVRLLTLANGGKARALNQGLTFARGEVIVALDADTQFEPQTIARLSRWFAEPEIGAVAGNAKVGNRINLVTRWQAVEYVTAQNLERRALSRFDAMTVVPGAVGAWRRAALDAAGGYPHDTLAEDQDLTIAIQRLGWLVQYDIDAVAWTEAPETFASLAKQRFRWAFGTLQCLWKHRSILRERRPAGLALVGLPQAWLFQIGFSLVSPLIDLALVASIVATVVRVQQHGWAQTHTDVLRMAVYWLAFTAIDAICGWIAYRLEARERRFPVLLLLAQRFVYRQIMYSVVLRAVAAAIRGPWVGWGKQERSGRVAASA
jgi:cellulose synthase/poly-beta-1,6-N-acetylglucosamine synthase-like glycosyltransferase/peptidoglycan/xylan/chitin deacetylase (PgdA/CDA1 family)/spore germination protein YaaH